MAHKRSVLILFLLSMAGASFGQTLTMGSIVSSPNAGAPSSASNPTTNIDLARPASASGFVTSVTFNWSASPCPNAVKIKFFRRQGDALLYEGERGPFNATGSVTTIALSGLGFAVNQGDLIGITSLGSCGNGEALVGGFIGGSYLSYAADVTSDVTVSGGAQGHGVLAVSATGAPIETFAWVLPAVASAPGGFGSNFKTSVQLFNPATSGAPMPISLVFHPANASGSPFDPKVQLTLAPQHTASYADIVAATGQSGLGSMDVIVPSPAPRLIVSSRVYNDGGTAGTSGFSEAAIDPSQEFGPSSPILVTGSTSFLVAPPDPATARLNIGIRTFFQDVTVNVTVRDTNGTVLGTASHTYPPTYFSQTTASAFTGLPSLPGNASIQLSVSGGNAIIYGATTDNTTNDGSVTFATAQFVVE